jgi:hypothetical protein
MHTRVGKSRSLAAAHWTATVCSSNLQPATASPQQPATSSSIQQPATCSLQQPTATAACSSNIVAASDNFAVGCPTFREKGRNIILLLKDFITFCSMLHFTYWSQQKSYLLELCEKLPDDYLPEQCNKIKSVTAGYFK